MRMQRQRIRSGIAAAIAVILLLVTVVTSGLHSVIGHAASTGDRLVDISTETITGYSLTIPLAGRTGNTFDGDPMTFRRHPDFIGGTPSKRQTHDYMLIFEIYDVHPLYFQEFNPIMMGHCEIEIPALMGNKVWWDSLVKFQSDVTINLRESYYNLLAQYINESNSSMSCAISVFMDGYSEVLTSSAKTFPTKDPFEFHGVKLEKIAQDPSVNDPNSPNYQPGDNGGSQWNPKIQFVYKVYDWFKRYLGVSCTYATFKKWFWSIVGVIAVLLIGSVVGMAIKIFKDKE